MPNDYSEVDMAIVGTRPGSLESLPRACSLEGSHSGLALALLHSYARACDFPSQIMLWVPRIPEFPVQVALSLCRCLPQGHPCEGRLPGQGQTRDSYCRAGQWWWGGIGLEPRCVFWGVQKSEVGVKHSEAIDHRTLFSCPRDHKWQQWTRYDRDRCC